MATTYEYNGHFVIIEKVRGKNYRKITIAKDGKVIKSMPERELTLRRAKMAAADYIGINRKEA